MKPADKSKYLLHTVNRLCPWVSQCDTMKIFLWLSPIISWLYLFGQGTRLHCKSASNSVKTSRIDISNHSHRLNCLTFHWKKTSGWKMETVWRVKEHVLKHLRWMRWSTTMIDSHRSKGLWNEPMRGQHIAKASASAQRDKNNQIMISQISKDSKHQF